MCGHCFPYLEEVSAEFARAIRGLNKSDTLNGIANLPKRWNPVINPLNSELNPICYLLALLGAHHFLHVSRIRVKSLTFRRLMSYIWSTHS